MRLDRTIVSIALVFTTGFLTACGEKKPPVPTAEEPWQWARSAFKQAVTVLQSPNRDGEVDYQAAYDMLKIGITNGGARTPTFSSTPAGLLSDLEMRMQQEATTEILRPPTFKNAMFNLGALLSGQGEQNKPLRSTAPTWDTRPTTAVRKQPVEALLNVGDHEGAIQEARTILLKDEANTAAYRNLSRIYYDLGNTRWPC